MRMSRAYVLPMVVFIGCVAASAAMVLVKYEWTSWRVANCVLNQRCFCEGVGQGFIRQWANTYSNLAFVFVGLWLWGLIRQDQVDRGEEPPPNLLAASPTLSGLYVIIVVSLGLMSMFYHASLSFVGQWFDIQAMYLITTFLVLYNLARTYTIPARAFVILYLLANAALGFFQLYVSSWRRFAFGTLLGLVLFTSWLHRHKSKDQPHEIETRWMIAAGVSLATAFAIWQLDINKIWCDPRSWLQGHAVWHALCALSCGLIFLYYRSETAGDVGESG